MKEEKLSFKMVYEYSFSSLWFWFYGEVNITVFCLILGWQILFTAKRAQFSIPSLKGLLF